MQEGKKTEHSLAGSILVAMPGLEDPNFSRTAVLVLDHSDTGAMGLVLNRPFDGITVGSVLAKIGIQEADAGQFSVPARSGGPVSMGRGFVMHDAAFQYPSTIKRSIEGLSVSTGRDVLEAVARGKGPDRYVVFLGYAGWLPGQLEAEIAAGSWLCVDGAARLVLEAPADGIADAALSRIGLTRAALDSMTGDLAHA